jgi:signal transduction histidine kinase
MGASKRTFASNLSISAKGLLLIAAPLVAQIAMLMVLRSAQTAVVEAERLATHSKDVILHADDLYQAALQAIASQRAAVVSGDPDYEDQPGTGSSLNRLRSLSALVADNPTQQARAAAIGEQLQALESWLASQRALVRDGRQAEAADRISAREGSAQLEAVRTLLAAFLGDEERLSQERSARLRRVADRSRLLTVIAAGVSFTVACLLAYAFSRGISARFAVLTENATRMAKREALTPPLAGSDEIAALDGVLHLTSDRLSEAAEAAAAARRELEQRLAQLALLNRELRQQTEENETFIYSVSHDLRSPLVNLQGFSKELTMSCAELEVLLTNEQLPPDVRGRAAQVMDKDIAESLYFIRTAVSRASDIIDSLLRLSRVGRVEYRWQHVQVNRIVANVVDAMRATITARGATIAVGPLDPAWGDPTAVEQIFANLVGNAVNYLDPARPGHVEVGMTERGAAALQPMKAPTRTYYVRDNGLGIPESALSKIFTAFHRHQPQQASGEGVGLALVRRIVERHDGRIWVESTEGVGSTFYVELPTEPAPVEVDPSNGEQAGAPR